MAIGLESAATTAVSNLDAAYAANPSGDINQMKADALSLFQDSFTDSNMDLLDLAANSDDPTIMVPDASVFVSMATNASAYVQAALDAEGVSLTSGGNGS